MVWTKWDEIETWEGSLGFWNAIEKGKVPFIK